jgi:hypothetical protein
MIKAAFMFAAILAVVGPATADEGPGVTAFTGPPEVLFQKDQTLRAIDFGSKLSPTPGGQNYVFLGALVPGPLVCSTTTLQVDVERIEGGRSETSTVTSDPFVCGITRCEGVTLKARFDFQPDAVYNWKARAIHELRLPQIVGDRKCLDVYKKLQTEWTSAAKTPFSFGAVPGWSESKFLAKLDEPATFCGVERSDTDETTLSYPPDGRWAVYESTPQKPGCNYDIKLGIAFQFEDKYGSKDGDVVLVLKSDQKVTCKVSLGVADDPSKLIDLAELQLSPNEAKIYRSLGFRAKDDVFDLVTFIQRGAYVAGYDGFAAMQLHCPSASPQRLSIDSASILYRRIP